MGYRKSRAIQARYCVFSSAREIELAAGGATLGLSFFGFFSSRLLRCWPFAMPNLPD
jgi:hypothetical protein